MSCPDFYHVPHPEVERCGIQINDRVVHRAHGRKGTVVRLSRSKPGVYVQWDGSKAVKRVHAGWFHLDDLRLL